MTSPRAIARAQQIERILDAARRQLAEQGAAALSLRAIARELGMVSSAIYRYVASRDDLLTALITEAYDGVGEAVERAIVVRPKNDGRLEQGAGALSEAARFRAAAHAIRDWARAHPHEFSLIYGTTVPGYRAPDATIGAAIRVPRALFGLVPRGIDDGQHGSIDPELIAQATTAASALGPDGPRRLDDFDDSAGPGEPGGAAAVLRLLTAWSTVTGFVTFELTGQFANTFDPAEAAAEYVFAEAARNAGLE